MAFKMNYKKGDFPFKRQEEIGNIGSKNKDNVDHDNTGHREGKYPPTPERQKEIEEFIKNNPGATHEDWYDWHFKGKKYKP